MLTNLKKKLGKRKSFYLALFIGVIIFLLCFLELMNHVYTPSSRQPANMESVPEQIATPAGPMPTNYVIWDFWISDLIVECTVIREIDVLGTLDQPQLSESDDWFLRVSTYTKSKSPTSGKASVRKKLLPFMLVTVMTFLSVFQREAIGWYCF